MSEFIGSSLGSGDAGSAPRKACDHPGCTAAGEFRAPKDRHRLTDYFWFCLDHVREYNKAWNYSTGMSAEDIEREVRNDTVWRRPTWPVGAGPAIARGFVPRYCDHLGLFESGRTDRQPSGKQAEPPVWNFNPEERRALIAMDLAAPLTLTALKHRYKELVKKLHPDANGGDKVAENRLKDINRAYSTLRKSLTT